MESLKRRKGDVVVLAIPRGGVVVANEVAHAIGAPLDLVITRKIGAPANPELAIGAVTQDGETIMDADLVDRLQVSSAYLEEETAKQAGEIARRMKSYRGIFRSSNLTGKIVVVVDDGIATGSTIKAAVISVRHRNAKEIIVAVPVAPPEVARELSKLADRVVCLETPAFFGAVGQFYSEFDQTDDKTVEGIMKGEDVAKA